MTTKTNRLKIREVLLTDMDDDFGQNISEDDDSNSDSDDSGPETESDDTSTDEYVSQENDSDSSVSSTEEEEIHSTDEPESVEKGGLAWSIRTTKAQGRLPACHVLKKKTS